MTALKLAAGAGTGRIPVLFVGGVHARELAPPAALLQLAVTLCDAYTGGLGITLGGFTLSAPEVTTILDRCDLHLLPMANPDGRFHNVTVDRNWRKSRNPLSCANQANAGTDINRNFDIAWDYRQYYNAAGEAAVGSSDNPCEYEVYIGPAGARQPETLNVVSLIDGQAVRWYVDVHSYGPKILYPWGMDSNGADPTMTFLSAVWDDARDGPGAGAYQEYFPTWAAEHVVVGNRMHDAVNAATGASYAVEQSCTLYATTGTSDDYAFSRNFTSSGRRVFAFTIECGSDAEGQFQPTLRQYPKIEMEVQAALLRLLAYATTAASSATPPPATPPGSGTGTPPAPAPSTPPANGGSWCFLLTIYGDAADPDVAFLRQWRDERLRPRPAGRTAIALYQRLSPTAARWLARRRGLADALRDHLLRPLVHLLTRR